MNLWNSKNPIPTRKIINNMTIIALGMPDFAMVDPLGRGLFGGIGPCWDLGEVGISGGTGGVCACIV